MKLNEKNGVYKLNIIEAKKIYNNPNGHNKNKLYECLNILNSQLIVFSKLEFIAIQDAHKILDIPLVDITNKSLENRFE